MDSMYDIYNLDLDGQLMTDVEIENAANLTSESVHWFPPTSVSIPQGPILPVFSYTATMCGARKMRLSLTPI